MKKKDDTLPLAAGGALAFLALGGAAVAMTRRRGDEEEELVEDTDMRESDELPQRADSLVPEEQPAVIAPAFAWGQSHPVAEEPSRQAGESHVDRAYGGPTSDNPSLSLRKRLKRAAFMDKRERESAAGTATAVEPTAGLPDRMVDVSERESELA